MHNASTDTHGCAADSGATGADGSHARGGVTEPAAHNIL
jgi:hypothetical protein